jgi:murein L,D-transpeptidase YcbB/YkuD
VLRNSDDTAIWERLSAGGDESIEQFQIRHGLEPTGAIDRPTLAALNTPIDERIRQVAISLERWRWMPDELGERHIFVNIPQYMLQARENHQPVFEARVVVGRLRDTTPVFSDEMTELVFSPYWNIPETIATDETMPAMEKDPDYLKRSNIEVLRASGKRVEVVDPSSVDWSDPRARRAVSFRQRPGSSNALGLVKFLFPNRFDVYIHDTPSVSLFRRQGRAFSHGCIRIQDPRGLAGYVLRDQPEWTAEAIDRAMQSGREQHVALSAAIPVHIVYFTAWVDHHGALHFASDVYGYDKKQQQPRAQQDENNTALLGS